MRSFLKRFRWPIVAVIVLGLAAAAISIGVSRIRPTRASWPPAPTPTSHLDAYRGLASWVDLYDTRAWRDPAAAVRDMAGHGVRTIFIETASTRSSSGIANRSALGAFVTEAHARQMYVVAWYPPNMRAGSADYDRIVQAVEFVTADGQKFDSVALDIESTAVKRVSVRNRNIVALSKKIRSRVGSAYPLGAIIPSPVGLRKQTGFWNVFPYTALATSYDVYLPMGYYTYHVHSAAGAYADTIANMRILRAQRGCKTIPVHLIGGLSGGSSAAEVRQFARGARETGCIGASLYDWVGTGAAQWRQLSAGWSGKAN